MDFYVAYLLIMLIKSNGRESGKIRKWKRITEKVNNLQFIYLFYLEFDANKTSSEKFKKISVMLDEVGSFVAQNLPEDVNDYVRLDVLNVHRDYARWIKSQFYQILALETDLPRN
jgi:hypothetical protein